VYSKLLYKSILNVSTRETLIYLSSTAADGTSVSLISWLQWGILEDKVTPAWLHQREN